MLTKLLAFIIHNKLILELFHKPVELFLVKLEVAVIHRESLFHDSDFLFESLDSSDVIVVGKVEIKTYR